MSRKKVIEEVTEEEPIEEEGEPAIFLRKVDVIICNEEGAEPTIIKAEDNE